MPAGLQTARENIQLWRVSAVRGQTGESSVSRLLGRKPEVDCFDCVVAQWAEAGFLFYVLQRHFKILGHQDTQCSIIVFF